MISEHQTVYLPGDTFFYFLITKAKVGSKGCHRKNVFIVDILPTPVGPLTQQLFILQASSSSPKVVFAKCMRTEQVTQARRR